MTVSLVFNDLCLRAPASDRETARLWMSTFVETLKMAVDHKVTQLRMHAGFGELMLSPDYPLGAWFGDNEVSPDIRNFVLGYATQNPLIVPYDADLRGDKSFQDRVEQFESYFQGEIAVGLGFAYLLDGLAFSMATEPSWEEISLEIDCLEWVPEKDDLVGESHAIKHVSSPAHVAGDHAMWIKQRLRSGVRDGTDLIRHAPELLPNLVFCVGARKQIEDLPAGSIHLPRILNRLMELEQLAAAWTSGGFDYHSIHNASGESKSTLGRFRSQRVFVCPDGNQRLFEWHLKGLPDVWRIHIWADSVQRKILIGYVGRHLPTESDKH